MRIEDRRIGELIDQLEALRPVTPAEAPPLPPPPPDVIIGGMDPWQQSVEKRLDSLDGRAQRLETAVGDIKANVSALTVKVDNLPTKDWIGQHLRNWIIGAGGILSIVTIASRFIGH